MYSGHPFNKNYFPTRGKCPTRKQPEWVWNVANREGYQVWAGNEGENNFVNQYLDSLDMHLSTFVPSSLWGDFIFPPAKAGETRGQQCVGDQHIVEPELQEALQFLDTSPGVPKQAAVAMHRLSSLPLISITSILITHSNVFAYVTS